MSRIWRLVMVMAALCVGLAAIAGGAAAKPAKSTSKPKGPTPGQLDPTFGKGGKVMIGFPAGNTGGASGPQYDLPFNFDPGHLQMAQAPGGKVVVAGGSKIVRYLGNGKLDPTFGNGGVVTFSPPAGSVFVLASVAVDSDGRVVLAGLARPLPTESTPDPVLSSAAMMRFDADGTVDTSFGSGGTLITEFGLGAPVAGGGHYPGASVGLRDVVIDSQNRPVISGAYVSELGGCTRFVNSKGFIARLTEAGALDPTFGSGGIRTLSTIATIGQIAPRSGGYVALAAGGPLCKGPESPGTLLTGLDENGNLLPSFGSFGFRDVPFREAPALAIAPSGKILLLGAPQKHHHYKTVKKLVKGKPVFKEGEPVTERVRVTTSSQDVQRLLPSGAADPSFARQGQIEWIDPPHGSWAAIAADQKERIYLAGRSGQRVSKSPNNTLIRSSFDLARGNPNGFTDRSFGKFGEVTTSFGKPTTAFATQVMLDSKGRILVGGGITSPQLGSGGGFAMARYLPGS